MNQNKKWTVTDVADRFEEAAQTLKRMPPVKVQGYFNAWPEIVRTVMEQLQADRLPMRMGPPSAGWKKPFSGFFGSMTKTSAG